MGMPTELTGWTPRSFQQKPCSLRKGELQAVLFVGITERAVGFPAHAKARRRIFIADHFRSAAAVSSIGSVAGVERNLSHLPVVMAIDDNSALVLRAPLLTHAGFIMDR